MGSTGFRNIVSDKDDHFTGELVQNAIESESIDMPSDWATAGINKCSISELSFQADQTGLDMELIFWSNSDYDESNLDESKIINRVTLAASDGNTIAGTGTTYYPNPLAQSIEYYDEDHTSKIHVSLVNRDATAKNSGATGEVVLRMGCTPSFS
tara:strand:- start:7647 stop:8108 length:462 start_codon:yes stop_codon:yes gene_type:complete